MILCICICVANIVYVFKPAGIVFMDVAVCVLSALACFGENIYVRACVCIYVSLYVCICVNLYISGNCGNL